jgi:hypothetical protein
MAQGNGEQQPQNQLLAAYQSWQERTAYATRFFVLTVIVMTILSFVLVDFTLYLSNITAYSVFNLQIYRFILSPFVSNSIFTLIMMLLFFPQMGTQMEQSMGTAAFGGLVFTFTLVTNVTFALICVLLYVFGMPEALMWDCSGFWTVIFSLITVDCMKTPDVPRRLMCLPWDIPAQYFPLAMYAFFSVFGRFELSFLVAIGVGYAYSKGHLEKVKLTDEYLESLEDSNGLLYNTSRNTTGWIFNIRQDVAGYAPVGQHDIGGPGTATGAGSSFSMGRPSSGGITGLGASPASSSSSGKAVDQFPGRGSQLAGSGSNGTQRLSDEEIKARRLAALSGGAVGPVAL